MKKALIQSQKILRENKKRLQQQYGVKTFAIFGSVSRGEETKKSDIDILVEFTDTPGIFGFIQLEKHLSKLLHRKVDLVTKKALKKDMKADVLKSAKYV